MSARVAGGRQHLQQLAVRGHFLAVRQLAVGAADPDVRGEGSAGLAAESMSTPYLAKLLVRRKG